jgi:hypothetical protein
MALHLRDQRTVVTHLDLGQALRVACHQVSRLVQQQAALL